MHFFAAENQGLLPIAAGAVETGALAALSLVCCIQYIYHTYYVTRTKRKTSRITDEIANLTSEHRNLEKHNHLTRLENQLLREFMSQTDMERASRQLLKYFVPNPAEGFAALIRITESRFVVDESRGLSKQSLKDWNLGPKDFAGCHGDVVYRLKDRELRQLPLWSQLNTEDRKKTKQLYYFPIGEGESNIGALVTTDLFPTTASELDQLDLAQRIMSGIGGLISQRMMLLSRESELRSTEELLELRSLTDRTYTSPLDMVQTFLSTVKDMLKVDGAALFLPTGESKSPWKAMVRSLAGLSERLWPIWQQHETRLLGKFNHELEYQEFYSESLQTLGISSLLRSALLVPLLQNQQISGVFCFARRGELPFSAAQRELALWASKHLGKTLVRLQSIADMKRLAQQDGLTELANRRTFDEQLDREIRVAQRAKIPCSLLLCDLDRFKSINDNYGHLAGDEVLKVVARILHQQALKTPAGERALTARYGGEELAIVLPGQDESIAYRVAEDIRLAVAREAIWWQQMPIRVTISIGTATCPTHASSAKPLIAAADEALYFAKSNGRNRVCSPTLALQGTTAE